MSIRTFYVALVVGLFAAVAVQAQTPATQPTPNPGASAVPIGAQTGVADTTSSAYVLGRDDVIEVGLIGGGYPGGRVRVQADGTVQLPFIGKVQVADHTTAEVSEMVRKALQQGQFFSEPIVQVEVVGYASRYIVVLGAVGNPGLIPMNRPYRMSEILARVGGVRDGAADYLNVRSADGKERQILIKDLATGDTTQDPYVQAGDKIYAPMAEVFYISGKVTSPGAFAVTNGITVSMAIAKAGGLAENGSDKKVDVTRAGKKVKLNLTDKVEPGDVIVVGEKMF
ncbi:MAG TPA: SLBB domain-containing protein [Phenylobacterium sp.]